MDDQLVETALDWFTYTEYIYMYVVNCVNVIGYG